MNEARPRAPVSIICVSNNSRVLENCLIRSVDAHQMTAPETELIVVENSRQQFSTAGAALNHGASRAQNEICVFVHQDVYLHSIVRLEQAAAALLNDSEIGLVGASGIDANGLVRGRMRDRVVLIGRAADGFVDVDSVDELLFMVRRQQSLQAPLSEDLNLAWHAYAVEYGARVRQSGKRVVVGRIPVTHNSLTTNLDRLTEAHAHISAIYPEQLPLRTTMGIIDRHRARQGEFLAGHRWRYRWLKGSRHAYSARRAIGQLPVVLSDIRMDIDDLLENCGEQNLTVIALESEQELDTDLAETIELERLGRKLTFGVANSRAVLDCCSGRGHDMSLLLTNVDVAFLPKLRGVLKEADALLGFFESTGFWLITGPAAKASPAAWMLPSARPLGLHTQ